MKLKEEDHNEEEENDDDIDGVPINNESESNKCQKNNKRLNVSSTLFITQISSSITDKFLIKVFEKFNGFNKLRLMNNYAVADYDNEEHAAEALKSTNNLKLTEDCRIKVSYANN